MALLANCAGASSRVLGINSEGPSTLCESGKSNCSGSALALLLEAELTPTNTAQSPKARAISCVVLSADQCMKNLASPMSYRHQNTRIEGPGLGTSFH